MTTRSASPTDLPTALPTDSKMNDTAAVSAPTSPLHAHAAAGVAGEAVFVLRDVSFAIPERTLVSSLSLTLPARRVVGLIGHNGSGKSTLIKMLARQIEPTGGAIEFEGRPLDAWNLRDFARKVAYLPQYPPATAGVLVKELVAFGRYPWHGALGRASAEDRRKIAEAMALTDVARFADRHVDTLSGGERQRVWLAMLIAQNADYLLLDEPISALDVAHQVEVLSLVHRLSQERGLGIIVVLHDVNMAARYCDDIVALQGGKLIARGTPDDIMTPARLKSIYGIAMGVVPHPETGGPVSFVL